MTQQEIKFSDLFINTLKESLTIQNIILLSFILFISIFIFHVSFKKYFYIAISLYMVYLIYRFVYDASYVQYLISLQYSQGFRSFISHYAGYIRRLAPSKAMPSPEKTHFAVVRNIYESTIIARAVYNYEKRLQYKLLLIARICIIILGMPNKPYVCHCLNVRHIVYLPMYKLFKKELVFQFKPKTTRYIEREE